jgi:hypothetical protein
MQIPHKQRALLPAGCLTATLYFILSTIITWWFIQESPLYNSMQQKMLSCGIAGAKWGIQITAAWLLLKQKKWLFIKYIGLTCFVGSLILLPYPFFARLWQINGNSFFVGSLLLSVAVMIVGYAMAVKLTGVGIKWWVGWLCCLALAISLQLTLVFNVL